MTHPQKLTHGGAGIGPPICLVSKLEPFIPTARAPSSLCFIGGGAFLLLEDVWLMAEGLGGEPGPALALSLCLPVHSVIVHVSSGLLSRQRLLSTGLGHSLFPPHQPFSEVCFFLSFFFFFKAFLLNICQIQ